MKEIKEKSACEEHNNWTKIQYEKYPIIYQEAKLPMSQTCMCWGFDIGPGWHKLIENLNANLQKVIDEHNIEIVARQVKEKFGTLRYYYHTIAPESMPTELVEQIDTEVDNLICNAENESAKICDVCGQPGKLRGIGWYSTRCDEHINN